MPEKGVRWKCEDSGYIGWCESLNELRLHLELLRACGVKVWKRRGTHSIFSRPEDAIRCRTIRKGIKLALSMTKGDPFDVVLGMRAAMNVRYKERMREKLGAPRWPLLRG
jgi:hypothetical protein